MTVATFVCTQFYRFNNSDDSKCNSGEGADCYYLPGETTECTDGYEVSEDYERVGHCKQFTCTPG